MALPKEMIKLFLQQLLQDPRFWDKRCGWAGMLRTCSGAGSGMEKGGCLQDHKNACTRVLL